MRIVISIFAVMCMVVLGGCGGDESTTKTTAPTSTNPAVESESSEPTADAAEIETGPTILGVDSELQKELLVVLAEFIEQQQFPGSAADHLEVGFEAAMLTIRRPASEFGIEPDADGNIAWPREIEEEMVAPLRAEFEAKTLFENHEIELPGWAQSLLDDYNAGILTPTRKELLFRIASGQIIKDRT